MKKKNFFMAAAVAAVCAGSIAAVNAFGSNDREFTALELANIEALTRAEVVGDKIPCHSDAKRNSKKAYVDCSKCERIEGWEGIGTEATCTR